jgi:hypothetical protein
MIPAATYVFKHALVRDAAYESLLKRRRQELRERTSHAKGRQCAAPFAFVARSSRLAIPPRNR